MVKTLFPTIRQRLQILCHVLFNVVYGVMSFVRLRHIEVITSPSHKINAFLCRHFDIISDFLFRRTSSLRHNSQHFVMFVYAGAVLSIHHFKSGFHCLNTLRSIYTLLTILTFCVFHGRFVVSTLSRCYAYIMLEEMLGIRIHLTRYERYTC